MIYPPPQPDESLDKLRKEVTASSRGKLKIFFGYAAGVGKTFAMLEAAQASAILNRDIVLGYVEPHSRPETEALTLGLEVLPTRAVEHRGMLLRELDLDKALARKPGTMVVDELAHTNAPGSRHAKRWQDVLELLEAGINVYSTLNVQHLESLNDVIAQVSGITVRETIPDTIFDQADSIELVDLPPEELLQRFSEGKVYVPAQSQMAMTRFFKLPNLIALRELALRRTADRVNLQMQTARDTAAVTEPWATRESLLVCVGPSPTSARVIRVGSRMASALRAPWVAAYVETGNLLSDDKREKLNRNLRLAEQLGGQTVMLSGQDVADELVKYAKTHNVTRIVIGKTGESRWKELMGGSIVSSLVHESGDADVHVIRGKEELPDGAAAERRFRTPQRVPYIELVKAIGVVAAFTGIAALMRLAGLSTINQAIIYFLGVAFVAVRYGRQASIVASFLSVMAFDFFFVPPYLTFEVHDTQYFITFLVMLAIALTISTLAHRIRQQAQASRQRERRTQLLYRFTRELAATAGIRQLVAAAEALLAEAFTAEIAVFLPDQAQHVKLSAGSSASFAASEREASVAQWVFEHRQEAGSGTDTLPDAKALYVPLISPLGVAGVLAVRTIELNRFDSPDQRQLLETLAGQLALAIERDQMTQQAQKVLIQMEIERTRSSLLSSVSHDLRTPLAAIAGTSSSLLDSGTTLSDDTRREMLETIADESNRMSLLVDNLLHITRLESGHIALNRQWYPLEEVVGSALGRLKKPLQGRDVEVKLPPDLPLVSIDGVLIEQVLINLLENATKYTPAGTPVSVQARTDAQQLQVEIADHGPGLTDSERQRVFDKFYRGAAAPGRRGAGLGLAITRAIVEAHGGRIWEENGPQGGARFIFSIPLEGTPPEITLDDHARPEGQ